jgi:glycerate kinase|nr:glycerate kinase [uncultured Oscillibacter sp.]
MKKCVVVSDSFKGTLSSGEIGRIAEEVIPRFFPDCQVVTIPVADGGEGTVECFMSALRTGPVSVDVRGPNGQAVSAVYTRSGTKAVIEMAAAAGLPLAAAGSDPASTTTYGVGELMRHAVEHGCTEILLGLGGSATNDGGCGAAAALGAGFYNAAGDRFIPTGATLDQIAHIGLEDCRRLLAGVKITAMCDIDNPLFGPSGAAYVFAPQKGAGPEMVRFLDGQLRRLSETVERELGVSIAGLPGAGAAGGMGGGCAAFLGAELKSGIEAILDLVDFDACLEGADLVITGEGRIDAQSVGGKVLSGVARRTRGVPLICVAGGLDDSAAAAYDLGVTAMFSINREPRPLAESGPRSGENYRRTLEDIMRLIRAVEGR